MPVATRKRRRMPGGKKSPSLAIENALWDNGCDVVVGLDEVGRGSWAGPLVVGAAVLPRDRRVYGVRDSKMLTEDRREELFDRLTEWCAAWSIGMATHKECDRYGMSEAQKLATRRAIEALGVTPDYYVIDGKWNFVGQPNVDMYVKGDAKCLSIATASIIAKVSRDRMMRERAPEFPEYNFANNKGYPCPIHKAALREIGMCELHRHSWGFMETLLSPTLNKRSYLMKRRDVIILRAAVVWTFYVWITRMWIILRDHTKGHGLAFKSVHAVLAIISLVFAVLIWQIASRSKKAIVSS